MEKKAKSGKINFNNVWVEITALSIINVILFIIIMGYRLSNRLPAVILFWLFLVGVIIHSYKHRFESFRFDLSKKGKNVLFIRACMPYVLTTLLFAQSALLIAWILFNVGGQLPK